MRVRALTEGERVLAQGVFGAALDPERARIAYAPAPFAVTLGRVIVFPTDAPEDFSVAPRRMQAWLVHELVHVWQFANRPAWTLGSWARVLACGGYGPGQPGYDYAHPFEWAQLNLEQQARVVEHAWLKREAGDAELALYAGRTPFRLLA